MTQATIVGNLTTDPELRFTPSGAAVANFTVASTPRTFDKHSNEWKDGETLFMRCSVWRDAAENVAESLTRGRPPHVIYVNVMERFAPAVPSLSQRLFWTACRTMQPFPSYLGEGRRGRWTA